MAASIAMGSGGCAINYINGLGNYAGPGHADNDKGPAPDQAFYDMFASGQNYDYNTRKYTGGNTFRPLTCSHLVFCQSQGGKYGDKFRDFLIEHKLGPVVEAPPNQNVHSVHLRDAHKVVAWLWAPDPDAVHKLWIKMYTERKVKAAEADAKIGKTK